METPLPPRLPLLRIRALAATALLAVAPSLWAGDPSPKVRGETTAPAPTYHRDIAPIVHARCMACHRPGESAPFPLTDYAEVSRRARTVQRVVNDRYMPPWHANPETTNFLDVRRLEDSEIDLINRWVEAGRPEGDPGDAPEPPSFADGWQLGEPDLVLSMAEAFAVPAEGPDIYRNFAIPLDLDEDKWVVAVELRPAARSVVHHTLFFLDDSGEARERDGQDGQPGFSGMAVRNSGFLGAYVPGATPRKLPHGFARALPKGTDLVLAHHFHPSGREELELSTVGIYFAETPPERRFEELQVPPNFGRGMDIDIPPGEAEYVVEDRFTLPWNVQVVTVTGHAHYLGRSMLMTATLPDGTRQTLLDIPDWDLNWQDTYHFAEETVLPAGTELHSRIVYDNSADNPNNPHSPPRRVKWGHQSTDEMGSITLGGVNLGREASASLKRAPRRQGGTALAAFAREIRASGRAEGLARAIRALDLDGDGILSGDELPERHRSHLLRHFDRNGDGALDARELEALQAWFSSLAERPPSPSPEPGKDAASDGPPPPAEASAIDEAVEVLIFVAIDCPIANSYAPEINRLHEEYGERGVRLSLIYPEAALSDEAVAEHRESYSLEPEGRIDRDHREVRRAGATITPEAAVFDQSGKLRYRGRIDDLYADYRKRRREPTERTLREVLDRVLAGEDFEFFETESLGCYIEPLPGKPE